MIEFDKLTSTYLIAEIGINHNGDMQVAKKLIDASFSVGWNCVKFQKRDPDISVPEPKKLTPKSTPWGEMTYLAYKKRIEFNKQDYDYVQKYCAEKPIDWTASVWDLSSLEFLLQYDIPFIKIPSAQLANDELVLEASRSNVPLILSTGMSTIEEIDHCVDMVSKNCSNFLLMHTNSSYPTPKNQVNLRIIQKLRERYDCPVGYSGHEYGLEPSVLAVALGAIVVERHVTLDHEMWGTDQSASIEITGMERLARRVKDVPIYLGSDLKSVTEAEIPIRKKLRGF